MWVIFIFFPPPPHPNLISEYVSGGNHLKCTPPPPSLALSLVDLYTVEVQACYTIPEIPL